MAQSRDEAIGAGHLTRPRRVPAELTGLPAGYRLPEAPFVGMVKIHDYERTPRYVRFLGEFACNLCGGEGAQVITFWRDKWPQGVKDEDVEREMKECIRLNHVHRGKA